MSNGGFRFSRILLGHGNERTRRRRRSEGRQWRSGRIRLYNGTEPTSHGPRGLPHRDLQLHFLGGAHQATVKVRRRRITWRLLAGVSLRSGVGTPVTRAPPRAGVLRQTCPRSTETRSASFSPSHSSVCSQSFAVTKDLLQQDVVPKMNIARFLV